MSIKKEIERNQAKQSRDSLSDDYIIGLLINGENKIKKRDGRSLNPSDIRSFPELIECKRLQIKIFRLLKSMK